MKIRDAFAELNSGGSTQEFNNGIVIVADDGRELFGLRLTKEGSLEVSAGSVCRYEGVLLNSQILVAPCSCNVVVVSRKAAGC